MKTIEHMLVSHIQASALLAAVNTNNNGADSRVTSLSANFKEITKNILSEHTVKCYVSADKIGSSRVVDATTAIDLLNHTIHIDQAYYLDYLKGLSLKELDNTIIKVEILPYRNQAITELLLETMLFKTLLVNGSQSGKIEWNNFEKQFHNVLSNSHTVSDFVNGKKYFCSLLLDINSRYLNLDKGASNDSK